MLIEKIKSLLLLLEQKISLDKKKVSLDQNIISNKEEHSLILKELETLNKKLISLKKNIAQKELDIKIFADHERSQKEKIINITKSKELDAIKREILSTQDKREQTESELLEMIDELETHEKKVKHDDPILKEKLAVLVKELEVLENYASDINLQIEPVLKEILSVSTSLPDPIKNLYLRISNKLDRPVVPVTNSSCGACYNFLSSQQLSDLKLKQIGNCKNCNRILFWDK